MDLKGCSSIVKVVDNTLQVMSMRCDRIDPTLILGKPILALSNAGGVLIESGIPDYYIVISHTAEMDDFESCSLVREFVIVHKSDELVKQFTHKHTMTLIEE